MPSLCNGLVGFWGGGTRAPLGVLPFPKIAPLPHPVVGEGTLGLPHPVVVEGTLGLPTGDISASFCKVSLRKGPAGVRTVGSLLFEELLERFDRSFSEERVLKGVLLPCVAFIEISPSTAVRMRTLPASVFLLSLREYHLCTLCVCVSVCVDAHDACVCVCFIHVTP